MEFHETVELIGKTVDMAGVLVMVTGATAVLTGFLCHLVRRTAGEAAYRAARQGIGRSILLGLELLVAGDIIRTVAVAPTFRTVGVLALIVLIRTFLSMTLEMEVSGSLPWRRSQHHPHATRLS